MRQSSNVCVTIALGSAGEARPTSEGVGREIAEGDEAW